MDWKVIATSFGIIFLAELGDKTQLAIFTLSAQHKSPGLVFIGASLALVLVTFLGAYLGGFVANYIPIKVLHTGAGILFIVLGASLLWQSR